MIEAAKKDGKLVVYGSCEEQHVAACAQHFQELFGIETSYQRLSTGEVESKVEEENGNPSADVWFGGTTDPYNVAVTKGILEPYEAKNASHLISDKFRDANGNWYGIYKGILGFFYNKDELERKGLDAPQDWPDLLDEKYKDLIWMSNYNTAGTAKLILNTVIQKYGHDDGIKYLVDLDKNVQVYTKSGSGPSKNVGTGECTIGIGFLHDAIYQIVDNGYQNIGLVIPSSGAPRTRLALLPSSRAASTRTPPSSGSSTLSRRSASSVPRRLAPTSSWSSMTQSSRRLSRSTASTPTTS